MNDMDLKQLIGAKIAGVRPLTTAEYEMFFWCPGDAGLVLILDNGLELIPVIDAELNGPGVLVARDGERYVRILI
jgi:hypothetical protein